MEGATLAPIIEEEIGMRITVLVKQTPDPEAAIEVERDGLGLAIEQRYATNLFDEYAVEEALRFKERLGAKVKVITLGGPKATEVLRKAIAVGVEEVLLLEDAAFQAGDGYATALALSRAIAREMPDLILCGRQGIDEDRAEVGPMVAEFLDLPHVGNATKIDAAGGKLVVERTMEGAHEVVEVALPAVITAQKGLNEPRIPPVVGVMKAMRAAIPRMTPADLGLEPSEIGSAGSKVRTAGYTAKKKRPPVRFIEGEPKEQAAEAVRILAEVERVV
jgi:electron transfer flavoprotein beta subunit